MNRAMTVAEMREACRLYGIAIDGAPEPEFIVATYAQLKKYSVAADAQPGLVTVGNNGIPAYLTNYLDPKLIEVLVSPMKAAQIVGETQKGDWKTSTIQFIVAESTGEVSSYGDFNNNGVSNANTNFPVRQSYHYQTWVEWGDRQLEVAGEAKIDWAAAQRRAAALALNKFQNKSYFYGIAGLQNYGLLNDPSLSAALTPTTKAAGGTLWNNALPQEILADVQKMFQKIVQQTAGLVEKDAQLTLAIHPDSEVFLNNTNSFGLTVSDMLTKAYPNLRIETAVEYLNGGVYFAQLYVDSIQGQVVAECCFTEKMRAHAVERYSSSTRQKLSQGTNGALIYQPMGIAQMTAI